MTATKRLIPPLFVVLWATGFIGARYAMPWAEPFAFLGVRFFLAFILLGALALLLGRLRLTRRQALTSFVAGVLIHGVYLGSAFWAIHRGLPAGLSALVAGLQPLITALLAGPLLGERVLPRHWLGLALGLAGTVVVLLPALGRIEGGVSTATLLASLVAVAGISAGTVWQKRFGGGTGLVAGTCLQYAGAATLMSLCALLFEEGTFTLNGELVFAMAWLVLVLSIGAIFLLMAMIRDGAMAKVASVFYLVPAVTALMAWLLFGERLSPVQLAGMALAAAGVALATAEVRTAPAPAPRNSG